MIKALIREFPVTDILDDMTEEKIRKYAYTKDEVDALIAEAVAEQRSIGDAERCSGPTAAPPAALGSQRPVFAGGSDDRWRRCQQQCCRH